MNKWDDDLTSERIIDTPCDEAEKEDEDDEYRELDFE